MFRKPLTSSQLAKESFFSISKLRLNPILITSTLFLSFASVSVSALSAASENAEGTGSAVLDYQDVFDLELPSNPIFANKGKSLIYERISMDVMKDSRRTALWEIDLKSKRHTPLINNSGSFSNPRSALMSPDGQRIAFVANTDAGAQIFTYYLDSQDITQVTYVEHSPSSITWSPDSSSIAFSMFTPQASKPIFKDMPKKPKNAQWAGSAKVIDKTLYRRDGGGYVPDGYSHLYIVPAEGGTPRQLSSGDYHHRGQLAFHPEAPLLYFASNRSDNWALEPRESDIYSINIETGDIQQVTAFPGPESSPALTDDGDTLVFEWVNDRKLSYQVNQIMRVDLDATDDPTSLTPELDRQITDWQMQDDKIVFSYIDGGETRLARLSLRGKIDKLDFELGGQAIGRPYTSGDFTLSRDGDIAFVEDNSDQPGDLVLVNGRKVEALTQLNDDVFAHLETAHIQSLAVTSSVDGRKIDAWIAYPPGFDKNEQDDYPLIIEIHGGPHAAYGDTFSMEVQLMAAKGYAVVWSNPRGSSSYGEDFANTIHHNYPSNDYDDLMDVVDVAIKGGHIDADNLFITGGSGGGVLTAWSIGKTDRFKAAVVAKPVINWMSFALTADMYPFFTQYWMPGMPWENHEHLWKHSPLSLVGNVKTPTMLLTGEADYRTPMSETEQYYHALRLQQIPSVMVRIPGASHGIAARPSHLIQKVGNIVAWFDQYNSQKADENE